MVIAELAIVAIHLNCADRNAVTLLACAGLAGVRIAAGKVKRVQFGILIN